MMGLTDFSVGIQSGLQDLIKERLAAQQRAQVLAQQEFQNQRQLGSDTRAQQQPDMTGESNALLRKMQEANYQSEAQARAANIEHQQNADAESAQKTIMAKRETVNPMQLLESNGPNSPVKQFEAAKVPIGTAVPNISPRLYTSPTDKTGVAAPSSGKMGYPFTLR